MKQLVVLLCVFFTLALSDSFVSNSLGSHMVLQRAPQKAQLWGWSHTNGSSVTVKFDNKVYTTQASTAGGYWSVFLAATNAGGPYTIQISSNAGESATLDDVLFGDVYVCSGQSNMQFTVDSAFNATEEVAAAAHYPNIRVFTVGQGTTSPTPLKELRTISQPWAVASPASIGAGNWSEFSATCWFFGRNLYDRIQVPLGLFSDNWGGTPVQAWSSPEALARCSGSEEKVDKRATGPNDASNLWNAMIVPILPMSIKGALWYQGEANTGSIGSANYYACAFPQMIVDWRKKWGGDTTPTFSFFFVQLSTWRGDNNAEAELRLAQMYATQLPDVGVATAMDWGDPTSPFGDIHPRYKQIVGIRLALTAAAITYGEHVQYLGPEFENMEILQQAPNARVKINYTPESIGSGLTIEPKKCDAGVPANQCATFEIGTSAGWVRANEEIQGNSVVISASIPANAKVIGARYAWATYPVATIYNKEGLPALPFAYPNPISPVKA